MKRLAGACAALGLCVLSAARAQAQEIPPPAAALVVGWAQYDLSGTGGTPFEALRADLPMAPWLYAELSFGTLRYTSQGGASIRHLTTEVQLQGTVPFGRLHPYLGAGAGGFFDLRKQRGGAQFARPTFSGAGGLRVTLPRGFGARAELRVRGIGKSFGATIAEWGIGASHTF
jgi:hypothetical protein